MGVNNSKKLAAKCTFLTKDEQVIVSNSFKVASRNSETVKENDLIKLWGSQMDPRLAQYITNFLFGPSSNRQPNCDFQKYAELYVYSLRGTADERLCVLVRCLGIDEKEDSTSKSQPSSPKLGDNEKDLVSYTTIKEFVESIVGSFMKIQKLSNTKQYKSWTSRGSFTSQQNVQKFAESLTSSLIGKPITQDSLRSWIYNCATLGVLLNYVFMHLYNITHKEKDKEKDKSAKDPAVAYFPSEDYEMVDKEKDKSLIPLCRGLDLIPSYPSLLDMNQLVFINSNLPTEFQYEWRFLFSSQIHGESFSTLIGRITNQGPSVLIVEDSNGYMFGGFAPSSWALSPNWTGNDQSFLFTLIPKMRVFPTTGYNNHYQYLNLHQQTMQNGLGMGGQHEYYGLWLECEYGKGHSSESCTTFRDYFQMSKTKNFKFQHLEVWALGSILMQDNTAESGASILDDKEARMMLEVAGKTIHSDGYRQE